MTLPSSPITRALTLTALLAGCAVPTGTSSGAPAGSGGSSASTAEAIDALASCSGLSQSEAQATAEIAGHFEASMHELVACGGLQVSMAAALVELFVNLGTSGKSSGRDGATTFADGVYTSRATGFGETRMEMRIRLGADGALGKKGDLVRHDVYDLESYFKGGKLALNLTDGKLRLTFSELGPLFPLLGWPDTLTSPEVLTADELRSAGNALGALTMESSIVARDPRGSTIVSYTIDGPATPVRLIFDTAGVSYRPNDASAKRDDAGQSLVVSDWGIRYVDQGLDGTVQFRVDGGKAPFDGSLTYENGTYPTVSYRCR